MTMDTDRRPDQQMAPNPLISELADDLAPVRPMTLWTGLAWVALAALATLVLVELVEGLWRGMLAGQAAPLFWIANGLLLILALASATSVVVMSGPRVGNRHEAPKWALAAVGVLPLAALMSALDHGAVHAPLADPYGLECAVYGLGAGLLTAAALTLWLRRGAPVSLHAAGVHTGLAAGAFGSVAYGLSCPLDTAMHLGVWHVLPVAAAALIGRFAIPPLARW